MPIRLQDIDYWRCVGIASSTVGLVCYALSSSFEQLYGAWDRLKSIIYAVVSLSISLIMFFARQLRNIRNYVEESHVIMSASAFTSWYHDYCDKHLEGNPDLLSVSSTFAFTLMSCSLSAQLELGYEVGVSSFFFGVLIVQLKKIGLGFACFAVIFCFSVLFKLSHERHQGRQPGRRVNPIHND